ncbi:MAG TPA: hypothetical protein VJB63_00870 [Patescibacteria group bacterium]|nr:hypothetical protein [Patescibacteria group bacterium]
MDSNETLTTGSSEIQYVPSYIPDDSSDNYAILHREFLEKQIEWSLLPLERKKLKTGSNLETWKKEVIESLTDQEEKESPLNYQPVTVGFNSPESNVQISLKIIEEYLNSEDKISKRSYFEQLVRTAELGIFIESDNDTIRRIKLRPLDLIKLRRYRYEETQGYNQKLALRLHPIGRLHTMDYLQHVAYLDDELFKLNLQQLRQQGIFGKSGLDVATYLQWGDKNVTTYSGLNKTDKKQVTLIIDPFRLGKQRNVFIDPETLVPEFSSKGTDNSLLELPGDSVMVFGGIPVQTIVGVQFVSKVGHRDTHYIVDQRTVLAKV